MVLFTASIGNSRGLHHDEYRKFSARNAETVRDVTTRSGLQLRLRAGYQMGAPPTDSKFTFDAECEERLNAVLGEFEGVHNFHNFTPAALAEQMSAQRCARSPL